MDETARHNRERWEELARAGVRYSRPHLELNGTGARVLVDPEGRLGRLARRRVLCLAGGGGQQSAAFALLGARVTVLDLSPTQLERDREAAAHYGVDVRLVEGDMRDLSVFPDRAFHIVHHAHSLPFVPDAHPVLREVARVLKPGGRYRLSTTNAHVHGAWKRWTGAGYLLTEPFVEGARIGYDDDRWDVTGADGEHRRVSGPWEYRHTLTTLVGTLLELGFTLELLREWGLEHPEGAPADPPPGSWAHFCGVAPPYVTLIARKGRRAKRHLR